MKHTTGPRRGRPRGNGKRFSSGKNQTFESSGPEVKIRGTAQQVHEKYLSLARDALSAGDRITAEGYFQFADHYFRIVTAANGNNQARQDRNNNIPPPPDASAGQIVVDEGDVGDSDSGSDDAPESAGAAEQPAAEAEGDAQPKQRPAGGRLRRRSKPASPQDNAEAPTPDMFTAEVQGAEPASQAQELAQALSRADGTTDAPSSGDDGAEGEEAPKRRRRSPLGIARKRPAGRSRKTAEAEAPKAEEAAGDDSGVVKTVRRGTRKTAAKTPDTATENA